MACSIQIIWVNLIVAPPGQTNQLRVMGRAIGCPGGQVVARALQGATPITGTSPPTAVNPGTDRFVITLPVTATGVQCGDTVTVEVWCDLDPTCLATDLVSNLECCSITISAVDGLVPSGSLTPTAIRVAGTLLGCYGDQVIVSSSVTGQSNPTSIDPLTGSFFVTLAGVAAGIKCDDRIRVKAWCAQDPACVQERDVVLNCVGCFRAQVSYSSAPTCTGTPPTRDVTLQATINVPAGANLTFQWDYGDGPGGLPNYGPPFTVNNVGGTSNTPYTFTEPPHPYAVGTYTARLVVAPPSECNDVPLSVTVQCPPPPPTCPTGTITATPSATCVNGMRTVTLDATITAPAGTPAFGQWDYGYAPPGGSSLGPTVYVPASQTVNVPQASWSYPAGTHTARIRFNPTTNPNCADLTFAFTVLPCPLTCDVVLSYTPRPVPCIPSGSSQQVAFVAVLNPTNPAYTGPFTWEVTQAGTSLRKVTQSSPAVANPDRFSHTFAAPGTYEVSVTVATPGCDHPFDTDVVSITIRSCCPSFQGVLTAQELSPCEWLFTAQVDNSNNLPLTFDWTFHDGTTQTTTTPTTTHTYAPGSITTGTTSVTMHAPGCNDVTLSTTVSHRCQACPAVATPTATVSGCAPGSAAVTLTTGVTPPIATSFDWTVTTPAGSAFTKNTTVPATTDGTADGVWTDTAATTTGPLDLSAPGAYAVTVGAGGPTIDPSCPQPAPRGFTVPRCTTPSEGLGCRLLRWLAVILLILAGLVLIIAWCVLVPPHCVLPACANAQLVALGIALGLALAGLIALAIWLLVCPTRPCSWGWLLAGQVLLGIGTFALYFGPCCWQLWIIGGLLVLASIFCFWRWVSICNIGMCTLAAEILVVLATVVIPFVAGLTGLPLVGSIIAGCISPIVDGIVKVVVAILSLIVANCILSGTPT